jgi:hypothetical protein
MLSEFLRSLGVGLGIPIAVFFVFRLRKGGFTKSGYTESGHTVQRVVIDKRSLVGLIVAILALFPIFL